MALERRRAGARPADIDEETGPAFDRWIDRSAWLDRWGDTLQDWVIGAYDALGETGDGVRSLLQGKVLLGHPLHPALETVPVGAFTAMVVADWLAVVRLVPSEIGPLCLIVGLIGMVGAALTGYTDYADTAGKGRRYATVHGLTMTVVLLAMVASLVLRYQPSGQLFFAGVLVSTFAYLVMMWAASLGGHLVYNLGPGESKSSK